MSFFRSAAAVVGLLLVVVPRAAADAPASESRWTPANSRGD